MDMVAVEAPQSVAAAMAADIVKRRGKSIRPKTVGQSEYVQAIDNNTVVFGIGPAGSGKTYLAVVKAVQALQSKQVKRIILTRPLATVTRENVRTLTRDTPLDGYSQVLLVDYEYVPTGGLDGDEVTAGQQIGVTGNVPPSGGCHLHLAVSTTGNTNPAVAQLTTAGSLGAPAMYADFVNPEEFLRLYGIEVCPADGTCRRL